MVVAAVKFVAIVPVSVSMVVVVVAVVDGARAYYIIYAAAASAMVPSFRPGLAASPLYRVAVLCHLLSRALTTLRLCHLPGCSRLVVVSWQGS